MEKRAEYKVVSGVNGFAELEKKVSEMLNSGWKPVGGLAFTNGYAYQAMARVVTYSKPTKTTHDSEEETPKSRGAQDAMRAVDELT